MTSMTMFAYGPRLQGIHRRSQLDSLVEECLQSAFLWDAVKDNLQKSALALSGGQQQRLCIARTLSMRPGALLTEEPCSALDPIATARVEELIAQPKDLYMVRLSNGMRSERVFFPVSVAGSLKL